MQRIREYIPACAIGAKELDRLGMVRLESVTKRFGSFVAVNNIVLEIKAGEFLTLLGPSGCGKTTTLRMIAGFEHPSTGDIFIDDKPVTQTPPFRRDVNTVFQNYALFPHLNVNDNVAFGLQVRGVESTQIKQRVAWALDLVKLGGYGTRLPRQLSGGQQQRVALARAIVCKPRVLLLDEPLGALDLKLRKEMQLELKELQRQLGMTFIHVTHDQEEALAMSDRVAVMNEGLMHQVGTAGDVYEKPETCFVARFIGDANLMAGKITAIDSGQALVQVGSYSFTAAAPQAVYVGQDVTFLIRPEQVKIQALSDGRPLSDSNGEITSLTGTLHEVVYQGATLKVLMRLPDFTLISGVYLNSTLAPSLQRGDQVQASWSVAAGRLLVQ